MPREMCEGCGEQRLVRGTRTPLLGGQVRYLCRSCRALPVNRMPRGQKPEGTLDRCSRDGQPWETDDCGDFPKGFQPVDVKG